MRIKKTFKTILTVALSATLVMAGVTPSQAYPTGQGMSVTANRYQFTPGVTEISAKATHVYPGCYVELFFKNYEADSVTTVAGQNGSTPSVKLPVPKKSGTYKLTAKTPWYCQPPTGVETATANVIVTPAHGTKTFTVSGFASGSSSLTPAIKSELSNFARQFTSATRVFVKGYTQGAKATKASTATALRRATNTYAFLKTINKKLKLSGTQSFKDLSHTGSAVRRVTVVIYW